MKRTANPSMDRLILDHLAEKYKLKEKREGIHLSTLVYCLTRSFFDQRLPIGPTDEEVMLFALGYGLQDVLTPTDSTTPTYEKDGIVFRPDFMMKLPGTERYSEIKTTRASLKKNLLSLPETWVEYIMGGCYIRGVDSYELTGLYMMGSYSPPFPIIYSETLSFEEGELLTNWIRLTNRKEAYEASLGDDKPPTPFQYCKDWECKSCRYRLVCDSIMMVGGKE